MGKRDSWCTKYAGLDSMTVGSTTSMEPGNLVRTGTVQLWCCALGSTIDGGIVRNPMVLSASVLFLSL